MRRRLLALASALVMVGTLASCSDGGGGGGGLGCSPVHIIVARGTFEPAGTSPLGAGAFANGLALRTGGSVWDVPYRADIDYLVAPGQGASRVVSHLRERAARCPNEKYVLTGYSKGAMVHVLAMRQIPASIEPRVRAVVLFGNPFHDPLSPANAPGLGNNSPLAPGIVPGISIPASWRAKTRDYCNQGDPICGSGINILAHLTYTGDTAAAIAWAVDQLR